MAVVMAAVETEVAAMDDGSPRFVAFSTIDDEPWEVRLEIGALLDRVGEWASLGIGLVRFTEILDCGVEEGEVLSDLTPLPEACDGFPTTFRGEGVAGLSPAALQNAEP